MSDLVLFQVPFISGGSGDFGTLTEQGVPVLTGLIAGQSIVLSNNNNGTYTVSLSLVSGIPGTALQVNHGSYLSSGNLSGLSGISVSTDVNNNIFFAPPNLVGQNSVSILFSGGTYWISGQSYYGLNNPSGFINASGGSGFFYPLSGNPSGYITSGGLAATGAALVSLINASNAGVSSLNGLSGVMQVFGQAGITVYTGLASPGVSALYISGVAVTGSNLVGAGLGVLNSITNSNGVETFLFNTINGFNLSNVNQIFSGVSLNGNSVTFNFYGLSGAGDVSILQQGANQVISGNQYIGIRPIVVDTTNHLVSFSEYISGTILNSTVHTGYNSNIGQVTASNYTSYLSGGAFTISGYPWQAFDLNDNTAWSVPLTSVQSGNTAWIQYQFSGQQYCTSYVLGAYNSGPNQYGSPSSWSISGSNDGTNWFLLDTRTNQIMDPANNPADFPYAITSNINSYYYYRMVISGATVTSYVPAAVDMNLFSLDFFSGSNKYPSINEVNITTPNSGVSIVTLKTLEGWNFNNFSGINGLKVYQSGNLIYFDAIGVSGAGGSGIGGSGTTLYLPGSPAISSAILTGVSGLNVSQSGAYLVFSANNANNIVAGYGITTVTSGSSTIISSGPDYQYLLMTGNANLLNTSAQNIHTFLSGNNWNLYLPTGIPGRKFNIYNLTPVNYSTNIFVGNTLQATLPPRWYADAICRSGFLWEINTYSPNSQFIINYYNLNMSNTGHYNLFTVPSGLYMVVDFINFIGLNTSGVTNGAFINFGSNNVYNNIISGLPLFPLGNKQISKIFTDPSGSLLSPTENLQLTIANASTGASGFYDYQNLTILAHFTN